MIFNIRFGFAANSSSTHSIIFTNENIKNRAPSDDYFGWDFFTLSKEHSKRKYLSGILYQHLVHVVGEKIANDLTFLWCGLSENDTIGNVDHQSVPSLPRDWNGLGLDYQFFKEYKKFLLNENVVILGGNDNDGEKHPKLKNKNPFILPLIYDKPNNYLVARKDEKYNYWTIFDRKDGTKIRMSFSNDVIKPTKASAPELVDLKITDYCNYACTFCYQGSSREGTHAEENYIYNIIKTLSENKVFEVAIGGGDPLTHPCFEKIIKSCKWYGIVSNFTVSNIDWLKNDKKRVEWLDNCGSVAYSVLNAYQVRHLGFELNKYNIPPDKFQVQIIEGVISENQFDQILKECIYHNFTLTILGFKETERGKDFKHKLFSFDWISKVEKIWNEGQHWIRIGVDTIIAEKYKNRLVISGIDDIFFSTREGSFSCYIDAVKQQIGPSSYEPDKMMSFTNSDFLIQKFLSF